MRSSAKRGTAGSGVFLEFGRRTSRCWSRKRNKTATVENIFSMSSPRARWFVKKLDNSRTRRRLFEQKYATYLYKRMGRRVLLNYMVR